MRVETSPNYTIIEGSNKQKILENYLNYGASNREMSLVDDIAMISSAGSDRDKADKYKNFLTNFEEKLSDKYDYRKDFESLDGIVKKL